jgi:APA family basic amino acid/polyamine antiporter
LLALSGSFEKILLYAGFVLQLMASLTVATSIFVKNRQPHTFSSPFRPWLQIIFLLFNTWVLVFTIIERPLESLIGIGIILAGAIIYYFDSPQPAEEAAMPG